ncbi:hypothetical protein D3C72_1799770 [compost metagenome]
MTRFQRRDIEHPIAHQVTDDLAPQVVVGVHRHAARQRQAAVVERAVVLVQRARILHVAPRDRADRGNAEPDLVVAGMR